ncbi:hypothetical protein AB4320_14590 [Vibrio splendidus]
MKFELNDWNIRLPKTDISVTAFVSGLNDIEKVKNQVRKPTVRAFSSNGTTTHKTSSPSLAMLKSHTSNVMQLLATEQFEPGELSKSDHYIEKLYSQFGVDHVVDLLSEVTMKCQGSSDLHSYLHFLNIIKNALDFIDYSKVKLIPFVAMAYDNIYVKEAAIGIFEGIEFDDKELLDDIKNALKQSDTSQAKWVNTYKNKVINELELIEL